MYPVLIVNDAEVPADDLAAMLCAHHIVVLNAYMRGQPEELRDEDTDLLKDWQGHALHSLRRARRISRWSPAHVFRMNLAIV
jgi:hypothetical protein